MANGSLRDLLLSIKVKVDKSAIAQTDAAFDSAAKSAAFFENGAYKALVPLKKIGAQLDENMKKARGLAAALLPAGALPARAPMAPSDRAAQAARDAFGFSSHPAPPRPGQSLAAPDVSAFMVQPTSGLDAFKAKVSGVMASARAKVQSFNSAFDGTAKAVFSARTAIAGLGVVIAGTAIGRFFGSVIDAGGALHDMSERTRVSVESLQVWRAIADDAGVDAGSVEGAFRKLTKSMAAAARGSKLQAASFKELGVQVKNSDGSLRPVEEVLIDTGSALAALDDDAKATAIAVQLLGPAGMGLVPAFNKGATAVRALAEEMRENVALNAEEAARLDDVGDALNRGAKKWEAMKARLAVVLLPVLEAVSNAFEKTSKWVLRMARETSVLQAAIAGLGGIGLARLVTMFGGWVARVGGARAAMALLSGGLRTAAVAAAEFLLPALALEDFLTFLAGGKSVFGRAFEEIFGAGGAKEARDDILGFFSKAEEFITDKIAPALKELQPIISGVGTVLSSLVLGTLNLVGLALSDDEKKTMQLAEAFERNMAPAVQKVADMIQAIGRAVLKIPGLSGAGFAITGAGDDLKKLSAEMTNAGKNFGGRDPSLVNTWGSANATNALRGFDPDKFTRGQMMRDGIVPMPAAPPTPKNVTLNDQRQIEINVGGDKSPGAMGRAVGGVVDGVLQRDRRQTLNAVSG